MHSQWALAYSAFRYFPLVKIRPAHGPERKIESSKERKRKSITITIYAADALIIYLCLA
jgi:hypothetical protein